jgi:LPXTG-motif cell wall-anchored protein
VLSDNPVVQGTLQGQQTTNPQNTDTANPDGQVPIESISIVIIVVIAMLLAISLLFFKRKKKSNQILQG